MIDRTSLDLRLAEHRAATTRIDGVAWQRQGATEPPAIRAMLAAALVALAARLDPAGYPSAPQPAVSA